MRQAKIIELGEAKVLRKYRLKFLVLVYLDKAKDAIITDLARQKWAMDLNEFKEHFPNITQLLFYKSIFKDIAKLDDEDWNEIPRPLYYRITPTAVNLAPPDWVIFKDVSSGTRLVEGRREIARRFHALETLEFYLKKAKLTIKVERIAPNSP